VVIEKEQMLALLGIVGKVAPIVGRGRIYEQLYTQENTPEDRLQELHSALVNVYSTCLELLANAEKLLSKNTAERTVHELFTQTKTNDILSKLTENENQLSYAIQICESSRSSTADNRVQHEIEGLKSTLQTLNMLIDCRTLSRLDYGMSELLKKEQLEILEWISKIQYREHHNNVKNSRTPGTCEWLLQNEKFQEWNTANSSTVLWLNGTGSCTKFFI
jgi:hypothetical protein